jgi:hypothetical protein
LAVPTPPDDHRLAEEIGGTLATELPDTIAWQPLRFNQIVIGVKGSSKRRPTAVVGELGELTEDLLLSARPVQPSDDPWTDDQAPAEWITDRMIIEFAAEGGSFDEEPLPTAP